MTLPFKMVLNERRGDEMVLKECREAKGLSQNQLARQVGCVRQTISMIERGINKPSVELAKRLADALEVHWTIFF